MRDDATQLDGRSRSASERLVSLWPEKRAKALANGIAAFFSEEPSLDVVPVRDGRERENKDKCRLGTRLAVLDALGERSRRIVRPETR